jgi:hypothetical protein
MATRRLTWSQIFYVWLLGAALPVGAYLASRGLYAHGILALIVAAFGLALATAEIPVLPKAIEAAPLALRARLRPVGFSARITVAETLGPCVLGFSLGQGWELDASGQLSWPVCRPAAEALEAALSRPWNGELTRTAACRCPLADARVEFLLSRAA